MVMLLELTSHGPHYWYVTYYLTRAIYLDFFNDGRTLDSGPLPTSIQNVIDRGGFPKVDRMELV